MTRKEKEQWLRTYGMTRCDGAETDEELLWVVLVAVLWPLFLLSILAYIAGKIGEKHRSKK